ncbi:MAG: hypothetical protein DRJ08_07840 [Acidobacteria bacterium]|nr:MAG: hypothetical protein DRJ08_07840 [Acidobacteriota bacterium]
MSREDSLFHVSLDLIKKFSSSEIRWTRGLLGEKLVEDILPALTDDPVLAVFWGEGPRFFSHGLSDSVADALQNQICAPHGELRFRTASKAGTGYVFSVPISTFAPGDPKLRLHFSDEIVVAPLGQTEGALRGIIGFVSKNQNKLGLDFEHTLSIVAMFAGCVLNFADEMGTLESFLQLTYQIVENDPSGIAICDSEGKILRANHAMGKLTSFMQEDLENRTISRFFQPNVYSELRERWRSDRSESHEISIVNAEGEEIPVRLSPYRIRQKDKTWYVVQLEDLRGSYELKQKEMEVERLQAVFYAAVTVNDKVNTPLTIILAHLERLRLKWKEGLSEEDLNKSLETVERQVDKITKTLSRMGELKSYKVQDYALDNRMMLDLSDSAESDSPHSTAFDFDDGEEM